MIDHLEHRTIDLFAGAGGLSLGFASNGFEIVAAVEFDADSAATYRRAHSSVVSAESAVKVHEEDIRAIDFTQYRDEIDVVIGGPPCQPWSLGGLRLGHSDPRDGIPQFARALYEIRPKAFVMENVSGLAKGSAKEALARVIEVLEGQRALTELLGSSVSSDARLGYTVFAKVLHAADYGVPQSRQRLFVVGLRDDTSFEWPEASHGRGCRWPHIPAGSVITAQGVGAENPSVVTYANRPSLRPDPYHGQIFNGGGRPIDLTKPAPTLLASMGGNKTPWVDTLGIVPAYHSHLIGGGKPRTGRVEGARRITVTEAAALQTFPPGVEFVGARSSQYRQVGNAVPPKLAGAVAKQVCVALDRAPAVSRG